jgi:hypothetical protein
MAPDEQHDLRLSTWEVMTLRAGLSAYLREFAAHRAEDDGASHPEAEWSDLKKHVGQLLWRLEEATKPPGAKIVHSEDAVEPDGA